MNPLVNQDKRDNNTAWPIIVNKPQIIPIGENLKKVDAKIPNIPQQTKKNGTKNFQGVSNTLGIDIENELEKLYIVAGYNEHELINANRYNEINNDIRVETNKDLLNKLENSYMLHALNISTPFIYNQTGLTEKFRIYDGNRNEMIIQNEDGVERLKHNADKGEGSSNMMRILYPSSAGTLTTAGGYKEAFKRDCDPSPELMGEIVAHLYKYRKDKKNGLKKEVLDPKIISNMSAYLGAKDEEDPKTGKIKTASQIRQESRNNIIGDYPEKNRILNKLIAIKRGRATEAFDKLAHINNLPQTITNIVANGEYSEQKYDEIMKLTSTPLTVPKDISDEEKIRAIEENIRLTKVFKQINKDLDITFTADDIANGLQGISNINENASVIKALNIYRSETEPVEKTINQTIRLIMEFPSLRFIRKDCLTTFIALIKNAEIMIDQESENIDGDNDRVLPKYTTEHMLMTYVLKEFGNTSSLNKFYDKVQKTIPKEEKENIEVNPYKKILNITRQVLKNIRCNDNSPYKNDVFNYSNSKKIRLIKDKNSDIIYAKAVNEFSDCAETASRHLINLLSYDKGNKWNFIYDEENEKEITKIESISEKIREAMNNNSEIKFYNLADRVKAFYYYQNKFGVDTDSLASHTFWNYVISNMNAVQGENSPYYNIEYNQKDNELLPGYINFLKLTYNIAYALKAGQGLKTANGVAYDDSEGNDGLLEKGKLSKARNAIDALNLNDLKNKEIIGDQHESLLQTAMAEVFSLYNKNLDGVRFALLNKNKNNNESYDISSCSNSKSKFKISRTQNKDDILNFGLLMMSTHAETYHTPYVNILERKIRAYVCNINPQLMLLPDMQDYGEKKKMTLFDRMLTSEPIELFTNDYKNSSFYNKFLLQNIINIVADEGITSAIGTIKILRKIVDFADDKKNIKINRINNSKDKNGIKTVTQKRPMYITELLKEKLINTVRRNDGNILSFMRDLNDKSEDILHIPKYKAFIDEIFEGLRGTYRSGENYYHYMLEADKAEIDSIVSKTESVEIPKELELNGKRYSVKSVFFPCDDKLERLILPDSIEIIKDSAFKFCRNLKSINIPAGVTSIGNGAFTNCVRLVEVSIPDSVKSIGQAAFNFCDNLERVELKGATRIESMAFACCDKLTTLIISDIVQIGASAFSNCIGLKNLNIPGSVSKIEERAFSNCTGLENLNIEEGVTAIETDSFLSCTSLKNISLPNSLGYLRDSSFRNCRNINSIEFKKCPGFFNARLIRILFGVSIENINIEELSNNRVRLTRKR